MILKASMLRTAGTRGVTLVELMVVIAIISIVAAVASPSIFRSIRRERAAGAAREVANELRRARNQAMARGEIVVVRIRTANRGSVQTFTTAVAPYERGVGGPCTTDDECGGGRTCFENTCWSPPARSCREFDPDPNFLSADPVAEYALNRSDAVNMAIHGTTAGTDVTLCFSPDGRVVDQLGRVMTAPIPPGCDGDNLLILVAAADATASDVGAAAVCNTDATARVAARDPINFYRVSVPYNGAISMDQ